VANAGKLELTPLEVGRKNAQATKTKEKRRIVIRKVL
jgi:hypothetical protein